MSYPTLAPSSRAFSAGNWPIKTFNAQDGGEVRILYGSKRFGHVLDLTYDNIPDGTAQEFFEHYYALQGTFQTFALPASSSVAKGWGGSSDFFNAGGNTMYRYAEPPALAGIRPGVSSVSIRLVAVLLSN